MARGHSMSGERELPRELTEALDHSIALLNQGESIDNCLALYPSLREELEPLLQVALGLQGVKKEQPSPEFRRSVREEIYRRFSEQAHKPTTVAQRIFSWGPRWAIAASAAVVILLGTGAVRVAADSLPDSPLYGIKRATEEAQLTLTPSAIARARLHASLADRRAREIVAIASRSDPGQIEGLAHTLERHLNLAATLAEETDKPANVIQAPQPVPPEGVTGPRYPVALKEGAQPSSRFPGARRVNPELLRLRETLRRNSVLHQEMLERASVNAPPRNRPLMRRIILENRLSYQRALRYLEQLGPGD